ncbi:N-acetylmuramoyl-L-alanine amidase [Kordia algicida OT-1]|uniref:N-acetylmuramoyl-L-alanine amidase domain-containing protein n=1 Tax=Kordia algicida OT-1 TaxID=391587 RepID=A9DWB4_9FLAO|nr:hypothetical protein [Kordia algicida]EDP96536.1 hypothetical protein KAOT1_03967 [Kordia algicida OT-1]
MKEIDYLIIHSTNTSEALDFGKDVIIKKHTEEKRNGGLGLNRPGFDYLIPFNGSLQVIIGEDNPTQTDIWGISNGIQNLTGIAKHIAYVGGRTLKEAWEKDTRTDAQKNTLETLVKFYVLRFPNILVLGFNEVPTKITEDSPAFSVGDWLDSIGIPEKNIYNKPRSKV